MAIHVSLGFAQGGDTELDEFASNVVIKMGQNTAIFATPTVPLTTISAAQLAFHNAIAATKQGGSAAQADKAAKRTVLVNLLRTQAIYVQDLPGMTEANALLSGFGTSKLGKRAPVSLTVPIIQAITNVASTQLGIKLKGSRGATGYDIQISVDGGAPAFFGHFSSTRGIVLTGLKPGSTYAVQARARSGNNQASAWSDPVSHMCT